MFKLNGKIIDINQDLTIGEGEAAITHPAANLLSAEYRAALGIEDVAVVTSGAMRNGLSLGVYAEAGGALRRMAALKDLGIDARIEPRYRERRRFYLVVRAVEAPRFDPAASVRPTACSP